MKNRCDEKQEELAKRFNTLSSVEEKYQFIFDLGRKQKKILPEDKIEENRVYGCQSTTYIKISAESGKIFFVFDSDALISAGLGALLSFVYSGEEKEDILSSPPLFLQKIGIFQVISPGRAQGILSMYAKLRKMLEESVL